MRLAIALGVLAVLAFGVVGQAASNSYWLLMENDGHTWCGYADKGEFTSNVDTVNPTETARVTYSSGKLTELTYQVEPESGDWVVVDKYMPSDDGLTLRRANLLTQENLQIVEETSIRAGKAEPFRVISTTTLDGKKAEASPTLDLPPVSIERDLSKTPFFALIAEMRKQSVPKLCKAF